MNELYIVTGNKGGVGKSFLSAMLADYFMRVAPDRLLVSDSESANGQASFWDVLRNDPKIDVESIFKWNLGTELGFEEMANAVEKMSDKTVVIDTGASMLAMLIANTEFISEVQKSLDCKIRIIFAIGALPESAIAARDYIQAIHDTKGNKIESHFVMISPTENKPENFVFNNEEDIQGAIKKLKMSTHFYGVVRQDFFDMTMKQRRLPNQIMSDIEMPFGTRTKYAQWIRGHSDVVLNEITGG